MSDFKVPLLTKWIVCVLASMSLQACKHPLVIVGEGDIVDVNSSGHGCSLEQFQARDKTCTENEVSSDYFVNYRAEPRPGWRFVRWEGVCGSQSAFQHCRLDISEEGLTWWEENLPEGESYSSTAVFAPLTGETGFLLAGAPVAGVSYETATKQGVTGLDGSFQYEPGETVRFMLGNTLLGEIEGQEQLTPFDLTETAVLTGHRIADSLRNEDDALHSVINMTTLLESLDRDADTANGIEISQAVAALLVKVDLDLGQEWEAFSVEWSLRHAIGRANRFGRFSTAHGLVNPALAMNRLYGSLGIAAPTVANIRSELIDPDSGEPQAVSQWEYDAQGNVIWHEDRGAQGQPETVEIWRYDERGNPIHQETNGEVTTWYYDKLGNITLKQVDEDGDGMADSRVTWKYDRRNHLLRIVVDADADGNPERTDSWQYDRKGRPKHYKLACAKPEDFPFRTFCLGSYAREIPDHSLDYYYDANNHLVRIVKLSDTDYDGTRDQRETTEYDASGQQTHKSTDNDLDGNSDSEWRRTLLEEHDDAGRLVRRVESWDENGDGRPERIETREFDASGNPTRSTYDWDGDGVPENSENLYYDATGNLVRREEDDNGDGIADEVDHYEYDAWSNLIRAEIDQPAGGRIDRIDTWQYDADGTLLRWEEDQRADGRADYIEYIETDKNGNIVRYRKDDGDLNGSFEYFETKRYDMKGNLLFREEDRAYDGNREHFTWTYAYDERGYLRSEVIEEVHGRHADGYRNYFQPAGWGVHFQDGGWVPDGLGF